MIDFFALLSNIFVYWPTRACQKVIKSGSLKKLPYKKLPDLTGKQDAAKKSE